MEKPDFEKMARQASPRKDFERVWPDEVNIARHAYIQGLREANRLCNTGWVEGTSEANDIAKWIQERIAELEAK